MVAQIPYPDPWRFQAHLEVWILVAFLTAAWIYAMRVIGPRVVPAGAEIVTRRERLAFIGAVVLLWLSSDWPVHDIAEEYLYSVHMVQHMSLTYFMPPLALLATPAWLMRLLVGEGRGYRALAFLSRPVIAAVLFNGAVMISHVPGVVNASVSNGPLHYTVHVILVLTSLLMWMPVCGPLREFRIAPFPTMIYLFLNSVVATIPAGWLTFAEGVVYDLYDGPVRVWGVGVTEDQQVAGAIMKVGGALFLWSIIVALFIKRIARPHGWSQDYSSASRVPAAEVTGNDDSTLTYADVDEAFRRSRPPSEPVTPSGTSEPPTTE
jgi:putative membrane protein